MHTAHDYNSMRDGVESPDDQRPTSADAQRARVIAIREGRLRSVPRDEVVPLPPEVAPVAVTEPPTLPMTAEELELLRASIRKDVGLDDPEAIDLLIKDLLAGIRTKHATESEAAAFLQEMLDGIRDLFREPPPAPAPEPQPAGTDAPEIQVAPTAPETPEPKGSESPDGS